MEKQTETLESAVEEREVIRRQIADATKRGEALQGEVIRSAAALETLAIGTNQKAYDRAAAEHAELEQRQKQADLAVTAWTKKLAEVNERIVTLKGDDVMRELETQLDIWRKLATELEAAITAYGTAYQKFVTQGAVVREAYPGGLPPIGAGNAAHEIANEVTIELYRQFPAHALSNKVAIPGAHSGSLLGDPRKLPTMLETIDAQISRLLVIAKRELRVNLERVAKSAKQAPPVSSGTPSKETPAAATMSAAQIMATLGPRKTSQTLDLRSKK